MIAFSFSTLARLHESRILGGKDFGNYIELPKLSGE